MSVEDVALRAHNTVHKTILHSFICLKMCCSQHQDVILTSDKG